MIRHGKNGEIIVSNGFDGGSYQPRYESRTSVYLGDMTSEDLRVKALVAKRKQGEAAQDLAVQKAKAREAKQRYLVQDYLSKRREVGRVAADNFLRGLNDRRFGEALKTSHIADVNPWIGSPFAGFGQAGEQRIHPDSVEDVEIVDAAVPSVSEYGLQNWMEDPSSIVDRSEDMQASYTPGKKVLQTMVDYAQKQDLSVVGLPATMESMTEQERAVYAKYMEQSGLATSSNESVNPNIIRYGIYALAAFFLLR